MAQRVLYGMLSSGGYDDGEGVEGARLGPRPRCTTGVDCSYLFYQAIATSHESVRVARNLAASSAVLLKNDAATLPLRPGARVALLGTACDAPFLRAGGLGWDTGDYYTLGGSGRVLSDPRAASTIASALRARAASGELSALTEYPHDDAGGALTAARGHDVAIACGGAWAREGTDRPHLRLDQDDFLHDLASGLARARRNEAAAAAAKGPEGVPPLVVAALAPGAIVAEWAAEAQAALVLFLTGQVGGPPFLWRHEPLPKRPLLKS